MMEEELHRIFYETPGCLTPQIHMQRAATMEIALVKGKCFLGALPEPGRFLWAEWRSSDQSWFTGVVKEE